MKIEKLPIEKPPIVSPSDTIETVVRQMVDAGAPIVAVVEHQEVVGLISEHRLLEHVISKNLPLSQTRVSEVMITPIRCVGFDASPKSALEIMLRENLQYLPVVGASKELVGIVSIADLLNERIAAMNIENKALAGFVCADGPGG